MSDASRDEHYARMYYKDIYLDHGINHLVISFYQLHRNTFTDKHPIWERGTDFKIRVNAWTDAEETVKKDRKVPVRQKIFPAGEFEISTDIDVANYIWWFTKRRDPDYQALYNICHDKDLKSKINPAMYNNYRIFKADITN